MWSAVLSQAAQGWATGSSQMGLAIGFAYLRIQFHLQEIDKQIVTKCNHLSYAASNILFVTR